MESAIRLCHSPLPSAPLRLSSGSIGAAAARASRLHLRFSHAPLCLSHSSTLHPVARSSGHVNCVLDRFSVPSNNEESDNKIVRGVTAISLVLACVLGLCNFSSKMNPKFSTAYAMESPFPRFHGGGEQALESLRKMINAEPSKQTRPHFPKLPDQDAIEALKLYAVGLSKSGKPDEAVKILAQQHERVEKDNQFEAEHFLEMALVELLIFQGKYNEADKRLNRQIDKQISYAGGDPSKGKIDALHAVPFVLSKAKFFLYKAILLTMLDKKEAAKWGEEFRKTLSG